VRKTFSDSDPTVIFSAVVLSHTDLDLIGLPDPLTIREGGDRDLVAFPIPPDLDLPSSDARGPPRYGRGKERSRKGVARNEGKEMNRSMRTRSALPVVVAIACAGVAIVFLLTASAHAETSYEVSTFGVQYYEGYCDYGEDDVNLITEAWSVFEVASNSSYWNYDIVRYWHDSHVDGEDFTDNSRYSSWGDDLAYDEATDWADTIFLGSHGWTSCMEMETPYEDGDWQCCGDDGNTCDTDYDCTVNNHTSFIMGDTNHCIVRTNDYSIYNGNIYFGNTIAGQGTGDANIFFSGACSSIDPCVRHLGGYSDMDAGTFNTYLGYYGTHDLHSLGSGGGDSALHDFLQSATNDDIGPEFLAHQHYENMHSGRGVAYVCPMILIWGSSTANCNNMYNNGGFKDFKDTGTHTLKVMYFVGGCDPDEYDYNLATYNRPALPDL
jgi:hypothetical protein